MDLEERQATAAVIAVGGLLIAVPVIVGLSSLFVAAWIWVLGIPGGHGMIFGWLSTKHHNAKGEPVWGVSRTVPIYFVGVVTAYICYQLVELLAGALRLFKEALA